MTKNRRIIVKSVCALLCGVIAFSAGVVTASAQDDAYNLEELISMADGMLEYYSFVYGAEISVPPTDEPATSSEPETTEPDKTESETTEPEWTVPETTVPVTTEPHETTEPCTTTPQETTEPYSTEPCSTAPPTTKPVTVPASEEITFPVPPEDTQPIETRPNASEISQAYAELEQAYIYADFVLNNIFVSFDEQEKEKAYKDLKIAIETAAKFYIAGDVNLDGQLNIKDVTLVQKYAAQLVKSLSDLAFKQGDINCDGKINVKDATVMQKRIAGLA